jgi:hypothetical protein
LKSLTSPPMFSFGTFIRNIHTQLWVYFWAVFLLFVRCLCLCHSYAVWSQWLSHTFQNPLVWYLQLRMFWFKLPGVFKLVWTFIQMLRFFSIPM